MGGPQRALIAPSDFAEASLLRRLSMFRTKRFVGTMLLAASSLAPLAISGCAARARVYDDYYSDYHYWNAREDRAYRIWLAERHYEYREYARLSHDQQREYWTWRHSHPNAG
jgi:hypothetical protein